MNNYLISPVVSQQLPDFVKSEYPLFVKFLERYYQWLEQSGNVLYESEKLANANDIDLAEDFYITLIKRDFLPFFPETVQFDARKFVKLINQFYSAKGTPNSVKFLFKALFNEEIDIYYPKDDILKVSDGKWVLPLALRIDTTDNNIFNIEKTLLVGQNSKATALVEKVIRSVDRQLGITYIEVYISNVQKLFETGETVVAEYLNDDGDTVEVSGRLIGSLSEIKIDANNRGLFYNSYDPTIGYAGDPVTIVGGLNPLSNTPIGAIAYVGETTKGSITDIVVTNGGFGFRDPAINTNSSIIDFKGGFENAVFGTEARAEISLLDDDVVRTMNVSDLTIETILTTPISNVENNTISTVSTYQTFNVYPISFVNVVGGGGGYRAKPTTDVFSLYLEDLDDLLVATSLNIVKGTSSISSSSVDFTTYFEVGDLVRLFINNRYEEVLPVLTVSTNTLTFATTFQNDISGVSVYKVLRADLKNLGSLGRINIVDGGDNYAVGEYLVFTGGSGYGANAKITQVHGSNNGIRTIEMQPTDGFVIGGEGYRKDSLPTITVDTASGTGADLQVLEITGDGESLELATSRIGAISKLRIISYGYDYVSAPVISLRNADMVVSNVTEGQLFVSNTFIYQGTSNTNTTFSARVDRFISANGALRIFDYKGSLDTSALLKSDDGIVTANVVSIVYYGDGRARATASFENGLIRLPGLYTNTDGQVSSDKRIQDANKYHNFSYIINTKKDYNSFRNALTNIVHPIGTKTFVNRIETNTNSLERSLSELSSIEVELPDTVNVSNGTKRLVSTNTSANLMSYVANGDIIILNSVTKRLSGTVNVAESNTVVGTGTNFIDEIQDGDTIYISSGNTEVVYSVSSANTLITQNTINVSSNNQTINVVFNDAKIVTFVNANTIFVDTNFSTNSSFVTATVRKVE